MYCVYAYLNTLSPKGEYIYERNGEKTIPFEYEVFYVGRGKKSRPKQHLSPWSLNDTYNTHKNNKIRKIQKLTGKDPIIVIISENILYEESIELEKKYIKIIGRTDIKTGPLTNKTDGGEGMLGTIPYNKGIPHPLETLSKMSKSQMGKKVSALSKQKSAKSNNEKTYKFKSPTEEEFISNNLTEFCKNNNLNRSLMTLVSNGKRKTHKGWKVEIIGIIKPSGLNYIGYYEYTDPKGNIFTSNSNSKFCKEFNLGRNGMILVYTGKFSQHMGWKCRKIEISKNLLTHYYEFKKICMYNYFLTDSSGNNYQTNNLREFCRNHKLHQSRMNLVSNGTGYHYKGWVGYKEKIHS